VQWISVSGRSWKRRLAYAWADGNYHGFDRFGILQQIRNQFGPTWLDKFDLSKEIAAHKERHSSIEVLAKFPEEPEAQELVLRRAADHLYDQIAGRDSAYYKSLCEAVDLIDDLRELKAARAF